MAQMVPFPPSSLPAYIDHSTKQIVCDELKLLVGSVACGNNASGRIFSRDLLKNVLQSAVLVGREQSCTLLAASPCLLNVQEPIVHLPSPERSSLLQGR